MAPNVKGAWLEDVVAVGGAVGAAAGAAEVVAGAAANWNVLPAFGAWTEAAVLLLVVDGVGQFPKSDLTAGAAAGAAAGCVVVTEAAEGVLLRVFVRPANGDDATVLLLVGPPNMEAVVLAGTVETGLVLVRDEGCPKVAVAEASPKMGLKVGAAGVLSEVEVVEDDEVALTEKMGLKPEASRGLALPVLTVAVTGFEAEDAAVVLI